MYITLLIPLGFAGVYKSSGHTFSLTVPAVGTYQEALREVAGVYVGDSSVVGERGGQQRGLVFES